MLDIFRIIGATGLVFIIVGLLLKQKERKRRDVFYVLGGALLEIYSISIGDLIFIVLQGAFLIATIYDMLRNDYIRF